MTSPPGANLHALQPEGGDRVGHVALLHLLHFVEVVALGEQRVKQAVDAVQASLGQPTRDLVRHLDIP